MANERDGTKERGGTVMAMYKGQVQDLAQSIAADVENIKRKVNADIAIDISINPRKAEVATTERLSNGSRITFDFEVVDGIAKTIKGEIVDKYGREVC